jgi:phosphatidylglycerol:prolipoprotein diacylglycerol transferase
MRRVLFPLFGFNIHAYPAFLYVGVVVGLIAGTYAASFRGLDPVRTFAALLLLVLPALVGSRLLFVAANWNTFHHDPRRIWQNSDGGASLYGGLILAFLASVPLLSALALPLGAFCDAAAITLLIGMVFTRVGCLLNGCCAGRPAHGPFSLCLPNHHGVWRRRLPTQLLEGGLGALLLLGSVALWNYLPFDGALALANVAAYSIGRWGLELTREDAGIDKIGSVSANRVIAAGLTVLAAACWLYFGLHEPPPSRGTISAAEGAEMPDLSLWYFLTAPLAVFAVLLLFRFVGCNIIAGLGSDYAAGTPPQITSPNGTTFTEGVMSSFEVNTTGIPTPKPITQIGLPQSLNLQFQDNGNGTATLSGTPATGSSSGSPYLITITASSGVLQPATQPFTLTVNPPAGSASPAFQPPFTAPFTEGVLGSFTVNTTGNPAPALSITGGNLPAGVNPNFPTLPNGMATLSGTPAAGTSSGSPYSITFTATNSIGDATQNFTLTVSPPISPSYSAAVYNDNPGNDNPVAFWRLNEPMGSGTAKDLIGQPPIGANPNGNHPGTYVVPTNPIPVSPPSPGANPPYLSLGQTSLLANPSMTDHSIQVQGGCVQVPWAAALNPAFFTLEAMASPGWVLTQKGFFYCVLSSVGASGITGFAVFAGPIGGQQQPNSDYHWMLGVGNGNGFAILMPVGFTVNSMGVLTYTAIVMNGTVSGDPLAIVTGLASTSGLTGLTVNGMGIPSGTTVTAPLSATSVLLSGQCTAGVNIALTFWDPNHGIVMNGTINSGALTTVTGLASTTGLNPGMTVSGMGIAAGTTIFAVTSAPPSVTLSAPGTAGVNIALTFSDDPGPIVTAETTYLACTYDGTNYFLYVGTAKTDPDHTTYQLVPPSPNYVPNADQTTNLFIGREVETAPPLLFPFSGNLEEVAIYNNALSKMSLLKHGLLAIFG